MLLSFIVESKKPSLLIHYSIPPHLLIIHHTSFNVGRLCNFACFFAFAKVLVKWCVLMRGISTCTVFLFLLNMRHKANPNPAPAMVAAATIICFFISCVSILRAIHMPYTTMIIGKHLREKKGIVSTGCC